MKLNKMKATLLTAILILSTLVVAIPVSAVEILEVQGFPTTLTEDGGHYLGDFSPDGSMIVYTGTGGIWVMDNDGSNPLLIYASGTRPDWGPSTEEYPDGLIALAGEGITVIELDGTFVKTIDITHSYPPNPSITITNTHSLDWSPDGSKIALADDIGATSGIWTVDYATGSVLTQITDYSATAYSPTWSPDGTEIACAWGASTDMYVGVFKSDGTQTSPLRTIGQGGRYGGDYPDWGSNGKIAYSIGDSKELYVMNGDGTEDTRVFDGPALMVAWSPDSKSLVYFNGFADKNIVTRGYPFATIQSAIDAASAGDTISVASGTYYENVAIEKSLDLIGADSEITIIDGGHIANTVTITASDVGLSGFTITGGYSDPDYPVHTLPPGTWVWTPIGGVVVNGNGGTSALTGITIEDNIIHDNLGNGVFVSAAGDGGEADNIVIRDNVIYNNGEPEGQQTAGISLTYLIYTGSTGGEEPVEWRRPKNILVEENTIYDNHEFGVYLCAAKDVVIRSNDISGSSRKGLLLASSMTATDIPSEGCIVEDNKIHDNVYNGIKLVAYNHDNTFTGNDIYGNGFGAEGRVEYMYGFLFQDGDHNTLQYNDIHDNAGGGLYLWGKGDPSYTYYSTTGNNILENTIYNHPNGNAIYVPAKEGYPNSGFLASQIKQNNIKDNQYGLTNEDTTQTIDATNNWWGTIIETDIEAMISGDVDYSPWLSASYPDGVPMSGSASIKATASYPLLSITVDSLIEFSELTLGGWAQTVDVLITHTGSEQIKEIVTWEILTDTELANTDNDETDIDNDGIIGFYENYIQYHENEVYDALDAPLTEVTIEYSDTEGIPDGTATVYMTLVGVPISVEPGTYDGTIVFWAEYYGAMPE